LLATNGIYEFIYPTVVGPRYSGNSENVINPDWNSNPYLKEGLLPTYTFNLDCSITSGIPLKDLRCTSHNVNINFKDKKTADISLGNNEIHGGNRDFILQYRLGGNGLESGAWLYSDGQEKYFMATLQPPSAVKSEMIPPREYIFIVDVSGSMYGFPMEITKTLVSELLSGLKTSDRFNILFFAGGANLFAKEPVNASRENIAKAVKMLESQSGSGGTELLPALKMALEMNQNNDYARTFVIATDGYVTVEKEAFSLIQANLNKANFFTFGIGTSVNRYLLEGMAHAGSGEATIITNQKEAKTKAEVFKNYISTPLLTNISIAFDGLDAYEVWPASIPDVFSSRPVVVFGKYRGNAKGNIVLSGTNGNGKFTSSIDLSNVSASDENAALKYLWAREQIRLIDDFAGDNRGIPQDIKKQVTKLGLKYNLLTAYTSFVAIDSEIRNAGGQQTSVNQPLPLPQGVSEYAVGTSVLGYALPFVSKSESRLNVLPEEETAEQPEAFVIVETMPEFPGGKKALEKYFADNLKYPEVAKNAGISGSVVVSFVVEDDGSLSDIKIIKGLGYGCDEEVLRLINHMPKWKPGKQRGKAVSVRITLPVKF
jgi:Ca-activated chloride channel family protein